MNALLVLILIALFTFVVIYFARCEARRDAIEAEAWNATRPDRAWKQRDAA